MKDKKYPQSLTVLSATKNFRVTIEASVEAEGMPLVLVEVDETPTASMFGSDDGERRIIVDHDRKDALLLALIQQAYKGDGSTFSKLEELMKEHKVPYKYFRH
jgi:hypothetical protein